MHPQPRPRVMMVALLAGFLLLQGSDGLAKGYWAAQPARIPELAPGMSPVEIPIELHGNTPLVQVYVNGQGPLWFELDTGFGGDVLDANRARALGLEVGTPEKVPAPGGTIERSFVHDVRLRVGGVDLPPQTLLAIPLEHLAPFFGHPVDGVLSYDFIRRFVVEIDYAAARLRLYDPQTYQYAGRGEVLPISFLGQAPYVLASVLQPGREPVQGRFEIDTGSLDALNLNTPFAEANKLFPPEQKMFQVRGMSLGGETQGVITRVEALRLGHFTIPKPVTSAVTDDVDRAGQISAEILRRFKLILDYSHQRVILEKNSDFNEPFELDMAGVFIVAEPPDFKTLKLFLVIEGTPAWEAGLRSEDTITSINGRPASEFSLVEVRRLFKQEGRRLRLRVQHGEEERSVQIVLRRLI